MISNTDVVNNQCWRGTVKRRYGSRARRPCARDGLSRAGDHVNWTQNPGAPGVCCFQYWAKWQSGHAAACKAVYAGSIPTLASTFNAQAGTGRIPAMSEESSNLATLRGANPATG